MNGLCAYNKLLRGFRACYRNSLENEIGTDFRRRFSVTMRMEVSDKKIFSFKSLFEFSSRKKFWDDFRNHCNEKLIVLSEIFTNQCNFIATQRIRRMSQMWHLYNRLYSEKTINFIVCQLLKNLRSKRRPFGMLFGASLFCWNDEKITDDEIYKCIHELDSYRSDDDHPTKPMSGHRLVNNLIAEGWEAVIHKECVQVYRKAFPNSYLYEYKIMGTFYDVPARTFFAVQTDIEYRKKWDRLVIKLDVIDTENGKNGCEVMHWVMHYPFPMYSREYVYIRRAVVSPKTNTMVLVSRSINHPSCPVNNQYVRVHQYSSRMVIRPHRTFDENGFDYVLTYFDDPQAAFPAPAYNWMASSGVPDFVEKLHNAALTLHQERKTKSLIQMNPQDSPSTNDLDYIYM